MAVLIVFLTWTPILIVASWVLEILVDTPSKNFAYQLDVQARVNRPPPPKPKKDEMMESNENEEELEEITEEEYYSCGSFSSRIWPIYAFIGWLVFVLIFTESLNAKYRAEAQDSKIIR